MAARQRGALGTLPCSADVAQRAQHKRKNCPRHDMDPYPMQTFAAASTGGGGMPAWAMLLLGIVVVIAIMFAVRPLIAPVPPPSTVTLTPLPLTEVPTVTPMAVVPTETPGLIPSLSPSPSPSATPAVTIPAKVASLGPCVNGQCPVTLSFSINGKAYTKKTSYAGTRHLLAKGATVRLPVQVSLAGAPTCTAPCIAQSGAAKLVLAPLA